MHLKRINLQEVHALSFAWGLAAFNDFLAEYVVYQGALPHVGSAEHDEVLVAI